MPGIIPEVTEPKWPELDAEALSVVKRMPPWIPGMAYNRPVKMQFNLPVNFRFR